MDFSVLGSVLCLSFILLSSVLVYWSKCVKRSKRSIHNSHGAQIKLILPARIFNLVVMWFRKVTGCYLLKFRPNSFLNEKHFKEEVQILKQVGPEVMQKIEIQEAQRKGLNLLCETYNKPDQWWTAIGRISLFWSHKKEFNARKQLIQYAKKNPALLQKRMDNQNGLLFITGLPRTGSTFLQTLLSLDPNGRIPRTWEMWYPVPPADGKDSSKHPNLKKMNNDIKSVNI